MPAKSVEAREKISNSYPSYERLESFLKKQPPGSVNIPRISKSDAQVILSFRTPKNIKNEVEFYNAKTYEGIELRPRIITQDYSDSELGYTVNTNVNNYSVATHLIMSPKSEFIRDIHIYSNTVVHEEGNCDSGQSIIIALKDEFRARLIAEGLIPTNSKSFIRIVEVDGKIGMKIDTDGKQAEIDDETLKKIQKEIQFDWEIKNKW